MNKLSVRRGIICTLAALTITGLLSTAVAQANAIDPADHGPAVPIVVDSAPTICR